MDFSNLQIHTDLILVKRLSLFVNSLSDVQIPIRGLVQSNLSNTATVKGKAPAPFPPIYFHL